MHSKIYLSLATQFYFDARLVLSFHIDAFVEAELIDWFFSYSELPTGNNVTRENRFSLKAFLKKEAFSIKLEYWIISFFETRELRKSINLEGKDTIKICTRRGQNICSIEIMHKEICIWKYWKHFIHFWQKQDKKVINYNVPSHSGWKDQTNDNFSIYLDSLVGGA